MSRKMVEKDPKIWPLSAHIQQKSMNSSNNLKDTFNVNPVDTFRKIHEKRTFDKILPLYWVQKGQKIWPPEEYFIHTRTFP